MNINDNSKPDLYLNLLLVQERVKILQELYTKKNEQDAKIFEQIADSHRDLTERLLVLEQSQKFLNDSLLKLQRDTSLQNKLLTAILFSIATGIISYLIKIYLP